MNQKISNWVFNVTSWTLLVWTILFALVAIENSNLKRQFSKLEHFQNLGFGYVQELTKRPTKSTFLYLVTYSFNSNSGLLFVSNELINYDLYKKMRLGDSIEIYRQEAKVFGQSSAISKIKSNEETPPLLENLYLLCLVGEIVLLLSWVGSLSFKAWVQLRQRYPLEEK